LTVTALHPQVAATEEPPMDEQIPHGVTTGVRALAAAISSAISLYRIPGAGFCQTARCARVVSNQ
jgi:hypothetical protein